MIFRKIATATALGLAFVGAAQAQGMYSGISYTQLTVDEDGVTAKPTQAILKVGYSFDKTWAIEGRVGLGGASDSVRFPGINVDFKIDSFSAIYGKASFPISEQFGVYGLVGYNSATAKASAGSISTSATKDGSSYGIGAEFNVTKNIGFNAEWARHFSDTTSLGFGVSYKF